MTVFQFYEYLAQIGPIQELFYGKSKGRGLDSSHIKAAKMRGIKLPRRGWPRGIRP